MNNGIYAGMTDPLPFVVGSSVQVINSSQTITALTSILEIEMCGGGAGGAAGDIGGESGAYAFKRFEGLTPGTQITIVIGAAGTGAGTNGTPARTSGGQSSISVPGFTIVTCGGGNVAGLSGGVAAGGDVNIDGVKGNFGGYTGAASNFNGGAGAMSMMGIGGRGGPNGSAGDNATGAGAGGGGGFNNSTIPTSFPGGNGAPGRLIARWYPA